MGWKSKIIELPVWLASRFVPSNTRMPEEPSSIFVLRSTDIGDLLVTTPVFQALRWRFPKSRIVAGIGDWNREILQHNPYVDEILSVNLPRYNKFTGPQRTRDVVNYIAFSQETRVVAARKFDIGIDILGSYVGSAFMMRTHIPYRLGVKGFIGGHSATQQSVAYNAFEHVGRAALRFAELLGATDLPACRPQIFLTEAERAAGSEQWTPRRAARDQRGQTAQRVVIGPGGGFPEKCWSLESYKELLGRLTAHHRLEIIIVGGRQDKAAGEELAGVTKSARNLAGQLSLRETFGLVAASDIVLCNSSMLMHAAAAFEKRTYVFLGERFPSAAQHHAQWGYPETCWVLGKDTGHPGLYTPQEAFQCISGHLADLSRTTGSLPQVCEIRL